MEKQQFKIGTVARLTGLSSHNIRAWEKRHQAVVAHRLASGRRYYTQDQIDRLIKLKKCTDLGAAISTIAGLEDDQLEQRLNELATKQPMIPAEKQMLSLGIIGTASLASQIAALEHVELTAHVVMHEFSEVRACENIAEATVDILIIECPNCDEAQCAAVREFTKRARSKHAVLIYRYATQRNLEMLKSQGVRTLKAPLDENSLQLLVDYYLSTVTKDTPARETQTKYPKHLFTLKQLEAVDKLPPTVECECPQHLAELLRGLKAFEQYSGGCINKNDDDAALHGRIQRKTAEARHQMETLLEEVLTAEGLSL